MTTVSHSLLSEGKLAAIRILLDGLDGVPGDLAELGVYRGGVSRLMATRRPGRTVHLFDTFTGIPADANPSIDWHQPGEFAAAMADVRTYLSDLPNVRFHPGLFPGTTAGIDVRFAFVHLDADLYTSTIDGLRWFWPRLSAGGVMILDDVDWPYCRGVRKAIDEFFGPDCSSAMFSEAVEFQLIVTKQ